MKGNSKIKKKEKAKKTSLSKSAAKKAVAKIQISSKKKASNFSAKIKKTNSLKVNPDSEKIKSLQKQLKEATARAKETNEKLYSLFSQAPASIVLLQGKDHTFEFANEKYLELIGKDKKIIGKTVAEVLPGLEEQGFISILDKVYKSGKPFHGQEMLSILPGKNKKLVKEVYHNFVYQPYKNHKGKVVGILAHAVDVTPLVKSRLELEQLSEKAEKHNQRLQAALDIMPIPLALVEQETASVIFANRAADHLAGGRFPRNIPAEEYLGSFPLLDKQGRYLSWDEAPVVRAARGEILENLEVDWQSQDGIKNLLFNSDIIPASDSEKTLVVLTIQDITERKKAEYDLRMFKFISDNATDSYFLNDSNGNIIYANKHAAIIRGYTQEELTSMSIPELNPQFTVKRFNDLMSRCKENIVPPFEGFHRHKNGTLLPVEISATYLEFENSPYLFAAVRDISERKKVEREIQYQKTLLEAMNEASPLGVVVVSPEGKLVNYNQRFSEMWKLPKNVLDSEIDKVALNATKNQLIDPEQFIATVLECYENRLENHEKLYFKDGRTFDRYGSPIRDEQGNYYGYVWFFLEITDQENFTRQKDEFIGIASHELRTPLTSIKAYMQLLERQITDPIHHAYVTKTNHYVNKLHSLIGDLLDVSKINAGKLQFHFAEFNFDDLVDETIETVSHTYNSHRIIRQGEVISQKIYGDKLRLEEVLINLLTNAIKYSPGKEKVIVNVTVKSGFLIVSVSDFGIGIPHDKQSKLFDRFYRVDDKSHRFAGLGIGLYIAAEIIKRHNGKIWVESQEGNGSNFIFTLPLTPSF